MKKVLLTAAALALCAGAASASQLSAGANTQTNKFQAPGGSIGAPRGMTNQVIDIDVTNLESWDSVGSGNNVVLNLNLATMAGLANGSQVTMTSIGWNVTGEALGASWASEMSFYFDDNIAPDQFGLFLRPLVGNNSPGLFSNDSLGQIDLSDAGIANVILPNGILRLEVHESFDDAAGVLDGIWRSGFLFVGIAEIPAPGATALFGLAGLAGLRRRR